MTPEAVQGFLDELAQLSLRHGLALRKRRDGMCLEPLASDFQGYSAMSPTNKAAPWPFFATRIGFAGALVSRNAAGIPPHADSDGTKDSPAGAPRFESADAFLAWADLQPECREMVDGLARKAPGGSLTQARLSRNALVALLARLGPGPCEAFGADLAVILGPGHVVLPGASVSCELDAGPWSTKPVVVMEVLSPATAGYDLGGRALAYQRLPSLRHLVLIHPDRMSVQHVHRDAEGQGFSTADLNQAESLLRLTAIGIEIPVAELYAQVTFAG